MIDKSTRKQLAERKERVRRRINTKVDPENYEFIPAKKPIDYYDNDIRQRVAVYARVSTDNVQQTSSYELQKKYYEDFVVHHPNWTLVKIYADEGISGTSLAHRDEFNSMIADCRSGKIDMIITKSVSRFARNVVDCISMVRMLAELPSPVGVFFESECIFSLKDDSQMALSFQATMAQEESHIRSRSMETSLRMRLDGGLPLTPKLLGYSHDADGNLVINPDEAPTVKLIFYMYLYGYSTSDIAAALTELGRKTYLGNVKWTSNSIVQVLRNERHCGDVLTRKTFTPNYLNHKARKNRGDRPQSLYRNHHEGIVSRDDFIAVQHLLNNSKYGNRSILPELRVIDSGLLRGFVTINPRWAGFKPSDYYQASASIHPPDEQQADASLPSSITLVPGDFDMRGFEIARSEFFDNYHRPYVLFQDKRIKFSTTCVRSFGKDNHVELLVNPVEMKFAVRTAAKSSRNAVVFSKLSDGKYQPRDIAGAAYVETLFQLFGWSPDLKYRIAGALFQTETESAYIFDVNDAEAFIKSYLLSGPKSTEQAKEPVQPLSVSGKRVRAVPEEWIGSFGKQYYLHQQSFPPVCDQSEEDWKIRMEGQLYETGQKLRVTGFDVLRDYICQELGQHGKEES
ncbi:recombinase family protein [Intestinimonas massiliensis]|uniref:Recombinase family protein n=1 Tax=Intestinimonas massiliensis (ex Afouda et al. 2020) TaxID=1673721 RepID=A0ABS9M942_9FIRM|nr:recombinase family protein [Intestinimonas massiliensis (ex Afouda et al. 2020)]MCG4527327.1 recombinase family protein [Intestinimonas massiliensis (ex Afouda et al. 2020)]MCQ4807054.1 recombinase family protein [Intestinimonas massiliensis (ex Afouda et al. 2020)]